jgi:type IV secretory pathway component VirB8
MDPSIARMNKVFDEFRDDFLAALDRNLAWQRRVIFTACALISVIAIAVMSVIAAVTP